MYPLRIASPSVRKTVSVAPDETPKQTLDQHNVAYEKAQIMLNGLILTAADMNSLYTALGLTETGGTLSVTAKMDNSL
jgi:hypothetical protein